MSWDSLAWYEKLGAIAIAYLVYCVAEQLFSLFVDFCDAVNHRIKYGAGVVLDRPKGDADE